MVSEKTILITGCSQGGLGDALARALRQRGHRVIATARNPAKMSHFQALGIEILTLDVLSEESIAQCVKTVAAQHNGAVDILINNSGAGYSIPLTDASLAEARRLFDLNVWSGLAMIQAFLPLLLKSRSGGMIVNNTSISSVVPNPMAGIYNMSKAAAAMMTDNLRLELAPFNIKVIELKTGAVKSKFYDNQTGGLQATLPERSIYTPAKAEVDKCMQRGSIAPNMVDAEKWAEQVVRDLLASNPDTRIWRGGTAWATWFSRRFMPYKFLDGTLSKMGALDVVCKRLKEQKQRGRT